MTNDFFNHNLDSLRIRKLKLEKSEFLELHFVIGFLGGSCEDLLEYNYLEIKTMACK